MQLIGGLQVALKRQEIHLQGCKIRVGDLLTESNKIDYHSIYFSFLFIGREPSDDLKITALLQIIFCSCATETTLCVKMAVRFPELSESDLIVGNCEKQTQSWNDKTIIELGYPKMSCLADQLFSFAFGFGSPLTITIFAQPRLIIVN